jgi:hypothetical protein
VFVNADFGYKPDAGTAGSIGDTVWLDANRNNGQDAGEPGIPGVTVSLIKDLDGDGFWDAGEPIIATDVTDLNGQYQFTGLPATDGSGTDDYLVWVNDTSHVLGELVPTYDTRDGASQGNPATGVVTGLTISAVTNLAPAGVTDADFAFAPPRHDAGEGIIGDTIFLDRNGSGTPQPGEGLEGVTVRLYDSTGTVLLATTTTDENGNYTFGGLPAATYTVKVDPTTLPAGVTNSVDPDGGVANQSTVVLPAGGVNLTQDFGYTSTEPNVISGTIWKDSDADGTLDGGEAGRFAGVTVVLYDLNGDVVATTTTDASGNYSFGNLPDGTYRVDVTDDNNVLNGNWKTTGPNSGADNNSQVDPYTVTVSGGQTNTTADFGYYNESAGLGNFVWQDLNNDGKQDVGESGLAVMVYLRITYPNGAVVVLSTMSDSNGYYNFANLLLDEDYDGSGAAGSGGTEPKFEVFTAIPGGHTIVTANVGPENLDSDGSTSGSDSLATVGVDGQVLVKGTVDNDYDFGFYPRPTGVTMSSFQVDLNAGTILVSWETLSEVQLAGFNVYRSTSPNEKGLLLNSQLIPAQAGGQMSGAYYELSDSNAPKGAAIYYWLEIVYTDGYTEVIGPEVSYIWNIPMFIPFLLNY